MSEPGIFKNYRKAMEPEHLLEVIDQRTLQMLMAGFFFGQKAGLTLLYDSPDPVPGKLLYHRLEPFDEVRRIRENFNPFCELFREVPARNRLCEKCDDDMARPYFEGSLLTTLPCRITCHMGLYDYRYPIRLAGRVRGVLFAGQRIQKENYTQIEHIMARVAEEVPELAWKLEPLIEDSAEKEQDLVKQEVSFKLFGEIFQQTVDKAYAAFLSNAKQEAIFALNQHLGQAISPGAYGWIKLVEDVLTGLEELFAGKPVVLLVRRQSRFEVMATSPSAESLKTERVVTPVVTLVHVPPESWQRITAGQATFKALSNALKLKTQSPLTLFRVDGLGPAEAGLSTILVLPWALPQEQEDLVAACARAISYPANVGMVFERINRERRKFEREVTLVGHQLKTPTQSALMSLRHLELMKEAGRPINDERRVEIAQQAFRQLLMAYIDAQTLQTVNRDLREEFCFYTLLTDIITALTPIAMHKGVTFHLAPRPSFQTKVLGVKAQLKIVFQNVLDNAVKYSFRGKEVRIRIERPQTRDALLRISNFGEGFPEEKRLLLFHYGERASGSDTEVERPGAGLGLAQALEYVESFSGSIDIESRIVAQNSETTDRFLTTVLISIPLHE
jgi:signal transduction histidine kinase